MDSEIPVTEPCSLSVGTVATRGRFYATLTAFLPLCSLLILTPRRVSAWFLPPLPPLAPFTRLRHALRLRRIRRTWALLRNGFKTLKFAWAPRRTGLTGRGDWGASCANLTVRRFGFRIQGFGVRRLGFRFRVKVHGVSVSTSLPCCTL